MLNIITNQQKTLYLSGCPAPQRYSLTRERFSVKRLVHSRLSGSYDHKWALLCVGCSGHQLYSGWSRHTPAHGPLLERRSAAALWHLPHATHRRASKGALFYPCSCCRCRSSCCSRTFPLQTPATVSTLRPPTGAKGRDSSYGAYSFRGKVVWPHLSK